MDKTYAVGDEIEATVTFREDVTVARGSPSLGLMVGGVGSRGGLPRGFGTDQLVFVYEVTEGDSDDDGVSVEAGRLAGGVVERRGQQAAGARRAGSVRGARGGRREAGALGAGGGRCQLDADVRRGAGRELDAGPGGVHGERRDGVRAVTGVAVSDRVVTLTLASAVSALKAVTVTYTPGADPIRDLVGNDAAALVDETVQEGTMTGRPAINGVCWVGRPLTAGLGTIADPDGLSKARNGDSGYAFSYQWIRVDGNRETDIPNQRNLSHLLPGGRGPGQGHKAAGELQGRRRQCGEPHQQGDVGGHQPADGRPDPERQRRPGPGERRCRVV